MKNDDLERLEKSQDVQQLIHFAKEQYEQEKSEHTPADFSSLMQAVRKNQKKRMRLKVSPWWLTAACLLGWTIGYGFPGGSNTQSDQIAYYFHPGSHIRWSIPADRQLSATREKPSVSSSSFDSSEQLALKKKNQPEYAPIFPVRIVL